MMPLIIDNYGIPVCSLMTELHCVFVTLRLTNGNSGYSEKLNVILLYKHDWLSAEICFWSVTCHNIVN